MAMKPWTPITTATVVAVAGVTVLFTVVDASDRGVLVDGVDPGEIACVDLVSGDLLLLLHDDYSAWGTDVYWLARSATESEKYGIVEAADTIVDLIDLNDEFVPIELHAMATDLADACVAAGFVTQRQVDKADGLN